MPASGAPGSSAASGYGGASVGADISNVGGIVSGLQRGGAVGYGGAAVSAGRLAAQNGAFGSNTGIANGIVSSAGNALGLYSGLKEGGVAGDTSAAVNAAGLATKAGYLGGASGALAQDIPYANMVLGAYNFATQDTKSGKTGSDALGGAETGAEVGSAFGPVGAVVGGVIGGAAGAVASAFGPGAMDAENATWNKVAGQLSSNPSFASSLSPSQAYQNLAGVMDARDNTPGHSQPIEQVFGRMGEQNLMDQMTSQINSAIASGQIAKNATPDQIYQQIVTPWLSSKGASIANNNTSTGQQEGPALQADLTQLISQWQNGSLNTYTPVGVDGQTIGGLQGYAGATVVNPYQASKPKVNRFGVLTGIGHGIQKF